MNSLVTSDISSVWSADFFLTVPSNVVLYNMCCWSVVLQWSDVRSIQSSIKTYNYMLLCYTCQFCPSTSGRNKLNLWWFKYNETSSDWFSNLADSFQQQKNLIITLVLMSHYSIKRLKYPWHLYEKPSWNEN